MIAKHGRLVFDSACVGAWLGTRGNDLNHRTLLFKADGFCVDVMVHGGTAGMHFLQGQVLHQVRDTPLAGARIRLDDESDTVATDLYGQFSLTSLARDGSLTIHVHMAEAELVCAIPPGDERESG
jgi:hypothetical protein